MSSSSENTELNKENIAFIHEFNLEFENIKYLIKLGKSSNNEELIIYIKEGNMKSSEYYQNSFTLEQLQKINECFNLFHTIDEIIKNFKDKISEKKIFIKKINDGLSLIFKANKDEKKVIFKFKISELRTDKKEDKEEAKFINKMKKIAKKAGLKAVYMAIFLYYSLIKASCVDYVIVTLSLLYFASPIDIIPDFIPIIGYLDDLAVLRFAIYKIKNSLLYKSREIYEEIKEKTKKKMYSIFEDIDEKTINEII